MCIVHIQLLFDVVITYLNRTGISTFYTIHTNDYCATLCGCLPMLYELEYKLYVYYVSMRGRARVLLCCYQIDDNNNNDDVIVLAIEGVMDGELEKFSFLLIDSISPK